MKVLNQVISELPQDRQQRIAARQRELEPQMTKVGPVLSPVDYDAWQRGYMPPSEHILIDELAYRGARVVCSSSGSGLSFWLVVKGDITDRKSLSKISRSLHEQFFTLEESMDEAKAPTVNTTSPAPPSE